jgi:predicted MFS family arabinose efflux permease
MIDLDNTLVDRDAAFRAAAASFLTEHALPADHLAWLLRLDASGYAPRQDVALAMAGRYGATVPECAVRTLLDSGAADRVTLPETTRRALGRAVAAGWTCTFATTATAAGILVTFLPLAVPSASAGVVTVALFVQPAAATVTRWAAGRYGDRHGSARLLLPGLLLSAAGVLVTAATGSTAAVVAGTALFGAGFGITQNATLTMMYAQVSASSYGTVSALWNLAYDGGMGVGAAGFAVLAGLTGYPWAFAVTAMLMLGALLPVLQDRRHTSH